MRRNTLRLLSKVPGLYASLAFVRARRVTVWGRSMMPELLAGDRLLVDRLAFARDAPKRGDVVFARHPTTPELRLLKRITAVAGDDVGDWTLLAGEYWVEGDHTEASTDSREFGPIRDEDLLGRAWVRYWPRERWKVLG
jgi:nickel-type superoxide dismutase maturation protease